jgi:hypothetical protein
MRIRAYFYEGVKESGLRHGGVAKVIRVKRKYYRKRRPHKKFYLHRRSSQKNVCAYCRRIIKGLPYQCHRCGRIFCSIHRLPETHKCAGLQPWGRPVIPSKEPISIPTPTKPSEPKPLEYPDRIIVKPPIRITLQKHTIPRLWRRPSIRRFRYWQLLLVIVAIGIGALVAFVSSGSTKNVYWNGGVVVGGDGHRITLHPNSNAKDPTWNELMSFLQQDKTEMIPYVNGSFVCADFAETLFNNAEKAGIRAGYVCMNLNSGWGDVGHDCNAFNTTDRGLVFIDDTGQIDGSGYDKQVSIVVGGQYVPSALFSNVQFSSMGIVDSYKIQW